MNVLTFLRFKVNTIDLILMKELNVTFPKTKGLLNLLTQVGSSRGWGTGSPVLDLLRYKTAHQTEQGFNQIRLTEAITFTSRNTTKPLNRSKPELFSES